MIAFIGATAHPVLLHQHEQSEDYALHGYEHGEQDEGERVPPSDGNDAGVQQDLTNKGRDVHQKRWHGTDRIHGSVHHARGSASLLKEVFLHLDDRLDVALRGTHAIQLSPRAVSLPSEQGARSQSQGTSTQAPRSQGRNCLSMAYIRVNHKFEDGQ